MSVIRLVISDVDGTIVTKDKSVRPETIEAARRLSAIGVPLALVSSRPPRGMRSVYDALGLSGPFGAFNGGYIIDGATVVAAHPVPEDSVRRAIAFFSERGIATWLFADDQWIIQDPDGDYIALERHTVGFDPVVVDNFSPFLARCGKVVGVSKDFDLLAAAERDLNELLHGEAVAHRSQHYYLDLTHPQSTKGVALQAFARWYDIPPSDILAIGDMSNDISMFREAGFSVAMGNAPDHVAAEASARTGSNNDTGWADAIEHYVLRHHQTGQS